MAITHPLIEGDANIIQRLRRFMRGGKQAAWAGTASAALLTTSTALALVGCAGQTAGGNAGPGAARQAGSVTATSAPSKPMMQIGPSQINDIVFESDCFGCATSKVLRVSSDGGATLTIIGKARHGTADQTSTASISRPDFERLAELLIAQGFFAMQDSYDDPQQQDGAWSTITATRAGRVKRVFSRADAQPDALRRIEVAIESWLATARWVATSP